MAMYRSDDLTVSEGVRLPQVSAKMKRRRERLLDRFGVEGGGRYHVVAAAMRRGCEIRRRKCKGDYLRGSDSSCALGALFVGATFRVSEWVDYYQEVQEVYEVFSELSDQGYADDGERIDLASAIELLNEDTNATRQQIADWLCHIGGCKHPIAKLKVDEDFWRRKPKEGSVFEDAPDPNYNEAA
jgi:hypothetical protein